jgi:two-component system cell cycle response regulator
MASRLRRMVESVLDAPDPATREFSRDGERLAALVRIVAVALIILIPLKSVIVAPNLTDNWIGLSCALLALLFAIVIHRLAWRKRPPRALGWVSTQIDVAFVTLGFIGFLTAGHPLTATNSLVQYTVYFLALAATCLRHDPRLCVAAGAAATLQYLAVLEYAVHVRHADTLRDEWYGAFSWDAQIGRLLLLAIAAALSTTIVLRAREHWREAIQDRLTGLYSRRFFEQRVEMELERARSRGETLVIAMADLDHFKVINDRWGHAAGDTVLRRFARLMRDSFRPEDAPARYGGEEFAMMLPRASVPAAVARVEAFRAAVEKEALDLNGERQPLTISLGLAFFPADGETFESLLAAADRRLYIAKRNGRNRVVGEG